MAAKGRSGEKQRKHPHYLKGTVFCGDCGSRLLVSNSQNRHGTIYPYFICLGRQQKRTNCQQSAVLIDTVEDLVSDHYRVVQPTTEMLEQLRTLILDEMKLKRVAAEQENQAQQLRRSQLLDEQAKLLQAHYADAVPIALMKSEQDRIRTQLEVVESRLEATALRFEVVEGNLNEALALASRWSGAYRQASPKIRRHMNQASSRRST